MSCPSVPADVATAISRARTVRAVALSLAVATLAVLPLACTESAAAAEPLAKSVPGLEPSPGAKSAEEETAPSLYPDSEGRARTSLFGVTGVGYKFVYVLDRSTSMGGSGDVALKAVKAELKRSLSRLDTVHQFQIIFYNEKPAVFNPSGVPGRLAFATRVNKDRAERFIESIAADGNTRHDDALKLAVKMRPDVIFFLTDGDEPKLTRHDLDTIHRMANGITIHTIEFGPGPRPAERSILATLAEENGGKYVYVDLSKRPAAPTPRDRREE